MTQRRIAVKEQKILSPDKKIVGLKNFRNGIFEVLTDLRKFWYLKKRIVRTRNGFLWTDFLL